MTADLLNKFVQLDDTLLLKTLKDNQDAGGGGGGSSAWAKISDGTITTPVAYFDVALPTGYRLYRIFIDVLTFSPDDFFAAVFSFDDAESFLNDTTNFDSYSKGIYYGYTSYGTAGIAGQYGDATLLNAINPHYSASPIAPVIDFYIKPGSASDLAGIYGTQNITDSSEGGRAGVTLENFVNAAATVAPTPARATTIRWLPYGNGDASPPTSGHTITAASWTLLGLTE